MARPRVANGGDGLRMVDANIWNKQSRTADKGWSSILVVGRRKKKSLLRNVTQGLRDRRDQETPESGSCEHVNEPSRSIKGMEFLVWMSDLASQTGLCSMEIVTSLITINKQLIGPDTLSTYRQGN
jgi:hypothetical protein